jgi:hypothetical protein
MLFIKQGSDYSFYTSLPRLLLDYPSLKRDTVMYYLSRNKMPYIKDGIEIYSGPVIKSKHKK